MVDNIIRTNISDENNFSFTHSHTYSTRPVVARCVFTFTIQIYYKGGILSIISNTGMFQSNPEDVEYTVQIKENVYN